ncbi:hypothetical protein [Flagellimonas pacifica]|uniref:Intein N-terminal splicing region n=1 Tax=Flagellimonas pacifica TaxID=1247520 RepID=A0A285MUC5_9FLAO|nr:hypothetical protein [Allomuricauda parva]SNZ00303.1 intein N-terminal splicing region [Allomuricauda parva]
MGRDLRELFEKERESKAYPMKKGHEDRFLSKLEVKLPREEIEKKSNSFFWIRIAAAVVILFGTAVYFFFNRAKEDIPTNTQVAERDSPNEKINTVSLGDLSPDLKKIESYYVTNINLELSELDFTGDNKVIVDSYMERLGELYKEYRRLTMELNEIGPNDDTINALIQNLQLRLQLLQKLRTKLNQLKSSKNEQKQSNII